MKELLQEAVHEIHSLRRRNEVLQAKVDTMELFRTVLFTAPAGGVMGYSLDVCGGLEAKIRELDAQAARDARPIPEMPDHPFCPDPQMPNCPCCHSNARVVKQEENHDDGHETCEKPFFCPCNEPGPAYFTREEALRADHRLAFEASKGQTDPVDGNG